MTFYLPHEINLESVNWVKIQKYNNNLWSAAIFMDSIGARTQPVIAARIDGGGNCVLPLPWLGTLHSDCS